MTMCGVNGEAMLTRTLQGAQWVRTDDEIHVSDELLKHADAVARIEEKYELGERCPAMPNTVHARLKISG